MADKLLESKIGLSESKLSSTTASASDVVSGKTFYSGDKNLKIGSFKISSATATAADVLSGKTFYAGNTTLKTGNYNPSISLSVITSGIKIGPQTITVSDPSIIYVIASGWISNVQPNIRPSISGTNIEVENSYGYGTNLTTTLMFIKITNHPATITMNLPNNGWQLNYTFAGARLS